jgi:hypothetical protein
MSKPRQSFTAALAGVFGLPDEKRLWPDVLFGGLLAFALLFAVGSLLDLRFDRTFVLSTTAVLVLIICAEEKRAVFAGALAFVGLRFFIGVLIGSDAKTLAVGISCLAIAGILLWWRNSSSL